MHLPAFDLEEVPARLTQAEDDGQLTLEFVQLSLAQRRALVTYLFCQPRQWDRPPRNELRALWEYLRAGLRIYPLAESP